MIKVIFMGTPDYASEILEAFVADSAIDVVSVYTQEDKPVGRKKVLTPPDVKVVAQKHNLPIFQPKRLRDEEAVQSVLNQECDFIVVAAYGQILPLSILNHAPCINLHASILPKYRGASPIQEVLLHGESKTGVTAMLMNEGLDTGDIIKIEEIPIADDMMVEELFIALTKVAVQLSLDVVKHYDDYTPYPQDESQTSYCKKITKADGEVSFDNAQKLYNKYRAYTPWPGIYLQSGLKIKSMRFVSGEKNYECGKILEIDTEGVIIGCSEGCVKVLRVQPPSKKEMSVLDYLNGKRLHIEDTLL